MTTKILNEQLDLSESQIISDTREIKGVVLIRAQTSKNKRRYSEAVLQKAAAVFEGASAFADHPTKPGQPRSIREFTGQYRNVRYENGALRADRVFSRTGAGLDAFAIAEDVINGRITPDVAGLSINAVGSGKMVKDGDGDVFEVESITAAQSVDDVAMPAAGGSYRESVGDDLLVSAMQAMDYLEWFEASGKHIERHAKELKTVRQDEALTAAKAEAEFARQALTEAQNQLTAAQTEREAAVLEAQTARRALAIERLLPTANVPKDWLTGLREQLMNADEKDFAAIIEAETSKAKAAGHRVSVTNAGQQVQPTLIVESVPGKPKPVDMNKFQTPEQLAEHLKTVRITQ